MKYSEIDCVCACGHDIWAHAKLIGEGCDNCECKGWDEISACVCKSIDLFNFGCTCGAFEKETTQNARQHAKTVATAGNASR